MFSLQSENAFILHACYVWTVNLCIDLDHGQSPRWCTVKATHLWLSKLWGTDTMYITTYCDCVGQRNPYLLYFWVCIYISMNMYAGQMMYVIWCITFAICVSNWQHAWCITASMICKPPRKHWEANFGYLKHLYYNTLTLNLLRYLKIICLDIWLSQDFWM